MFLSQQNQIRLLFLMNITYKCKSIKSVDYDLEVQLHGKGFIIYNKNKHVHRKK